LCRYPPFDISSSAVIAAASTHLLAPLDASTQSTTEQSVPINVSSSSPSCQVQGDVAEEMQVDQLLEMKGDMASDWSEEEYEDDEILWMMVSLSRGLSSSGLDRS
jgi:hypothetical protein